MLSLVYWPKSLVAETYQSSLLNPWNWSISDRFQPGYFDRSLREWHPDDVSSVMKTIANTLAGETLVSPHNMESRRSATAIFHTDQNCDHPYLLIFTATGEADNYWQSLVKVHQANRKAYRADQEAAEAAWSAGYGRSTMGGFVEY